MGRGIVLFNMGGPNSIDEVGPFLRAMFSDPHILPMHPWLRRFVGRRIVQKRLHEAEENYRLLGGKSPLTEHTRSLASRIEAIAGIPVVPAMRYVPPSASEALERLRDLGADSVVLFPMYPHYSTTTTRSSLDDIAAQLAHMDYAPALHHVAPYYDDPGFVAVVVDRIMEALGDADPKVYDLILSAHGLPMRIIRNGDPYQQQIEASVRSIRAFLENRGIHFRAIRLAYQSKVGSGAWLEPSLADCLRRPQNRNVILYPLAFTVDNSETRFELDIEHRAIADAIGYDDYRVAACPNDGEDFARWIAHKALYAFA